MVGSCKLEQLLPFKVKHDISSILQSLFYAPRRRVGGDYSYRFPPEQCTVASQFNFEFGNSPVKFKGTKRSYS